VLQCVAVCCRLLQFVAAAGPFGSGTLPSRSRCVGVSQCVDVCCNVLQCVAVCGSVWQSLQHLVCGCAMQCCCGVLSCVEVC